MIEQETVLALIEMKEKLEQARDILWQHRLDKQGTTRDDILHAHYNLMHALALIESILAKGR